MASTLIDWLQVPLDLGAGESLRKGVLARVSDSLLAEEQARTVVALVRGTEIQALFDTALLPSVETSARRKLIEIDTSLKPLQVLLPSAVRELRTSGVSEANLQLLAKHLQSDQFRYRVAAYCAIISMLAVIKNHRNVFV